MNNLPIKKPQTIRMKSKDPIEDTQVGDWVWAIHDKDDYEDEEKGLYCVAHKGSNFFDLRREGKHGGSSSIDVHFDKFEKKCTAEPNWKNIIENKVDNIKIEIQKRTQLLIAEGKKLCLIQEKEKQYNADEEDTLLPAVSTINPKKYKKELVEFRDNRMPLIQKEIKELSKEYAKETKNLALPDLVKLQEVQKSLRIVEDRIFTIELYCGLQETVHQIKQGEPTNIDEPIAIRQLLLFMDEETLFDYDDGGMDFQKLEEFDKWVVRPENLKRILPEKKGIVAFRVRRDDKDYGQFRTMQDVIVAFQKNQFNMQTYLLIRNGENVYRIASDISFAPRLVPLKDEIGIKQFMTINSWYDEDFKSEVIGPDSVKFDSHVKDQDALIKKYNRIFIFIQGLLDRSTVFHPHPNIKLNIPEQINVFINCIRDEEETLPNLNAIDWETYRDQINKSIKIGYKVWSIWSPDDIGSYDGSYSRYYTAREYEVLNRPNICKVKGIKKDLSEVLITWEVEYWGMYNKKIRNRNLWIPMKEVFNIRNYNLGDYKMFLCDRTVKSEYKEWAMPLLTAEEYARKKIQKN